MIGFLLSFDDTFRYDLAGDFRPRYHVLVMVKRLRKEPLFYWAFANPLATISLAVTARFLTALPAYRCVEYFVLIMHQVPR